MKATNKTAQASYLSIQAKVNSIDESINLFFSEHIANSKIRRVKSGSGCAVVPINIPIGNNAHNIEDVKAIKRLFSSLLLKRKKNKIIGIKDQIKIFTKRIVKKLAPKIIPPADR